MSFESRLLQVTAIEVAIKMVFQFYNIFYMLLTMQKKQTFV